MTNPVKSFLAALIRRIFRPTVGSIVAPLNRIADDLARLKADNLAANAKDFEEINRIGIRVAGRVAENNKAISAEEKIRNLLS